jgi:hypothetical protein
VIWSAHRRCLSRLHKQAIRYGVSAWDLSLIGKGWVADLPEGGQLKGYPSWRSAIRHGIREVKRLIAGVPETAPS